MIILTLIIGLSRHLRRKVWIGWPIIMCQSKLQRKNENDYNNNNANNNNNNFIIIIIDKLKLIA